MIAAAAGSETGMATEVRETEWKYEAVPGTRLPPLADLPEVAAATDPAEQKLQAEYFDTDDLRLLHHGITLRRRRGGDDAGWHLKLPAGAGSRDEIRLPLGRSGRRVPAELAALVRVYARGQELRPVALITTRRQLRVLLDDAGSSLAEVVADDVSAQTMGDSAVLSRWHEVEVELTGGSPRLLQAADKRLRRSGLNRAAWPAKLERALAGQLPAADRQEPTPQSTAAEVVLAYAGAQLTALQSLDPMVRRDLPDSVHQMRVAVRRLRSTLKSFRTVLRREDTRHIRAELKWLGSVLGAARDGEVLAGRLRATLAQLPPEVVMGSVQAQVREHFAPIEAAARAAVLAALDSQRYLDLVDGLEQLLAGPPLAGEAGLPAAQALPPAVRRSRRRVHRRLRRARSRPAGPGRDAALHEVRKAAKDARYAAEAALPAVRPAARKRAGQFVGRMKKLQSVLGDHHDAVVARGVVRELGVRAHLAGENAFSFGVLYQLEGNRARGLDERAEHAWKRASGRKYRRWLR